MKKTLGMFLGLAMTVSTLAQARSIMKPLEPVLVKSITLEGDFMPGPGFRPHNPLTVLKVQVDSNGCTDAEDFKVVVTDAIGGKQVSIIRVKPDLCRAFFPQGTEVELTTGFVGFGQKVFLANPVRLEDNTTH